MGETKTCPFCGQEILATAKKCKHCGKWLEMECPYCAENIPANSKICPQCKSNLEDFQKGERPLESQPIEQVSVTKNVCPFCGSEIPTNTKKCKYCGEWLTTPDKDKPRADLHLGAWIEGIIILIAIFSMFSMSFENGLPLVIVIYIALHLYFLPSLIADNKRTQYTPAIFALNLLLGATVIVWVVCLVWALVLPNLNKVTNKR